MRDIKIEKEWDTLGGSWSVRLGITWWRWLFGALLFLNMGGYWAISVGLGPFSADFDVQTRDRNPGGQENVEAVD